MVVEGAEAGGEEDPVPSVEGDVRVHGRQATPRLLWIVPDAGQPHSVRHFALEYLSKWNAQETSAEVRVAALRWMAEGDAFARRAGIELSQEWPGADVDAAILGNLKDPAQPAENRTTAAFVLANRGVAAATPTFRELLRSEDVEIKRAAIICLGIAKDPESRKAVEEQVRLGPPRLREAAESALMHYEGRTSAERKAGPTPPGSSEDKPMD